MSINEPFGENQQTQKPLQENVDEGAMNEKEYSFFKEEVSRSIEHSEMLLASPEKLSELQANDKKPSVVLDNGKTTITYVHLQKDGGVAILNSKKDGREFSCVLKRDSSTYKTHQENAKQSPSLEKYLPKVYGVEKEWVIIEFIPGIEDKEVVEKLSADENFRHVYAENATDFIYTTSNNKLITGDLVISLGHNVRVDDKTGKIKLTEIDNIAPYPPEANEQLSSNELIFRQLVDFEADQLIAEAKTEPKSIAWRTDMLYQLFARMLKKINLEDVKKRYRYISYPEKLYDKFERDGFGLNPKFIEAVKNADMETIENFLLGKENIRVSLADTPENRIIVKEDSEQD
jgi:hypothetical protein